MVVSGECSEVKDSLMEVKKEIEVLQVSITAGQYKNVQELTEVTNVIDELQQNRKMISEIKEFIPTKTSEAQRKRTPKVLYSRKEKD